MRNWWHIGKTYALIGSEARALGDMAHARSFFDLSLAHTRRLHNSQALLAALGFVEQILYDQELFADALAIGCEHLTVAIEMGGKGEIAASLQTIGDTLTMLQAYEQAAMLWGASAAIRTVLAVHDLFTGQTIYEAIRMKEQPAYQNQALQRKEQVRHQLGEAAFDAVWTHGQSLTAGQALALLQKEREPGKSQ